MFTLKQKNILLELICNKQLKHIDKYNSKEYNELEELKIKIRTSEVTK